VAKKADGGQRVRNNFRNEVGRFIVAGKVPPGGQQNKAMPNVGKL